MSIHTNPCIAFPGNAREAMTYYHAVLGGDLTIGTASDFGIDPGHGPAEGAVIHAVLSAPSGLRLIGWDAPKHLDYHPGNNVAVFVEGDDKSLHESFSSLAREGTITRPLELQQWGREIGSLVDAFGITWMFSIANADALSGNRTAAELPTTTSTNLDATIERLAGQDFRARFRLYGRDRAVVDLRGINTVRDHAVDIISKRLAPAAPEKDGRQTPYRGHPVFVAQHATATCCRSCLFKWHEIPVGRALDEDQIGYVVDLIIRWISRQYMPLHPPA